MSGTFTFLPPSSLNSSLLYDQHRLGSACRLIHRSHLIRHLPRYIWNLPITKPCTSWALETSYLAASLDDSPGHTGHVHHWEFKSCPWTRSASEYAPPHNEPLPSRLVDHLEGGSLILVRHCVLINAHQSAIAFCQILIADFAFVCSHSVQYLYTTTYMDCRFTVAGSYSPSPG
jgi:hypothetical protein